MDKQSLQAKITELAAVSSVQKQEVTKIVNAWRSNTLLNSDYDVAGVVLDAVGSVAAETLVSIIEVAGRLKADANGTLQQDQYLKMIHDMINIKKTRQADLVNVRVLNVNGPYTYPAKKGPLKGKNVTAMNISFFSGGAVGSLYVNESDIESFSVVQAGKSYDLPIAKTQNGGWMVDGDPVVRETPSSIKDEDLIGFMKQTTEAASLDMDLTSYVNSGRSLWFSGIVMSPRKTPFGWNFSLSDENRKTDLPEGQAPSFRYQSEVPLHDYDRAFIVAKIVPAGKNNPNPDSPVISCDYVHVLKSLFPRQQKASPGNAAPPPSSIPPSMNPSAAFAPTPPPAVPPAAKPTPPPVEKPAQSSEGLTL